MNEGVDKVEETELIPIDELSTNEVDIEKKMMVTTNNNSCCNKTKSKLSKCYKIKTGLCFLVNAILCVITMFKLFSIHYQFQDILNEIQNPQIIIAEHEPYWGPVQIICSNDIHHPCTIILEQYSIITTTQNYLSYRFFHFSTYNYTVNDILRQRHNSFYSLIVLISVGVIISVCIFMYQCCTEHRKKKNFRINAASMIITFYLKVYKIMICNIFSVSEINAGVLMIPYLPWDGLVISLIVGIIFILIIILSLYPILSRCYDNITILLIGLCIPLLLLIGLCIIPLGAISIYYWQFNHKYQSTLSGLLDTHYMETTEILASIGVSMGFIGWYETARVALYESVIKHILCC